MLDANLVFYAQTSFFRIFNASSQYPVHVIISTPPYSRTPKRLIYRIHCTRYLDIMQNGYSRHSLLPLTFILTNTSTLANRRPPISSPPPVSTTKLFLATSEEPNQSGANNVSPLFPYPNGFLINRLSKSKSHIVGTYPSIRYPDYTDVSRSSVSGSFYPTLKLPRS